MVTAKVATICILCFIPISASSVGCVPIYTPPVDFGALFLGAPPPLPLALQLYSFLWTSPSACCPFFSHLSGQLLCYACVMRAGPPPMLAEAVGTVLAESGRTSRSAAIGISRGMNSVPVPVCVVIVVT